MPTTDWNVASGGDGGDTIDDQFAPLIEQAEAARDKAQQWAINPEDDPVETVPDRFSALHHAAKAMGFRNESETFRDEAAASEAAAAASAASVDMGALNDAMAATAADVLLTHADAAAVDADRILAEAARDASFVNAKADTTIAAARARVADGETFLVIGTPNDEQVTAYRRETSTTETLLTYYPTSALALQGAQYRAALSKITQKIVEGSGTVSPNVYRGVTWASGDTYQVEVLARAGERRYLNMYCSGGYIFNVTFDLELGICSGAGGSITAMGEGWFRCRVTGAATGSSSNGLQCRVLSDVGNTTYTGDGVSGLYVDNVSVTKVGVGAEILASGDISTAGWTKTGATVTTATVENLGDGGALIAVAAAAIGTMSADKFTEAAGTVTPSVYRSSGAVTIGATYVHEVVAKRGERSILRLYSNLGFMYDCTFDLLNGTATGTGAAITYLGEGWYRCAVTRVPVATTAGNCQIMVRNAPGTAAYTGDGTSGLYVNSASLTRDGVELWGNGNLFGGSAWAKLHTTVTPDVALYRTINLDDGSYSPPPLAGVKWAALGTSITVGGQYTTALAALTGMICTNAGISSASIAAGATAGALGIYNAIATIPIDSQLVTIEAGINDFGHSNSDLGALGDTTTATFYGALYAAVVAIQARAPSAKIVFLTPYSGDIRTSTHRHFRVNTKGNTLLQFQRAVSEVAAFLGLPCVDVGQEAGLGYLTLGPYSSDGLHINATGGARYAAYVADRIVSLHSAGMMGA